MWGKQPLWLASRKAICIKSTTEACDLTPISAYEQFAGIDCILPVIDRVSGENCKIRYKLPKKKVWITN